MKRGGVLMASRHRRTDRERASATLVAATLMVAACGPSSDPPPEDAASRYGAAVCAALASCECYFEYETAAACEVEYSRRMSELLENELTFDEECFEEVLTSDTLVECAPASDFPYPQDCDLLTGSKRMGEACAGYFGEVPPFGVDECEGDLVCRAGYCRGTEDVLPRLEVGDACDPTEFAPFCQSDPTDSINLYCASGGSCQAQVGAGSACDAPSACDYLDATDIYCAGFGVAGEGVCSPRSALGEPCDPADHSPCASDPDSEGGVWCSATERVCVSDGPRACSFPFHR